MILPHPTITTSQYTPTGMYVTQVVPTSTRYEDRILLTHHPKPPSKIKLTPHPTICTTPGTFIKTKKCKISRGNLP